MVVSGMGPYGLLFGALTTCYETEHQSDHINLDILVGSRLLKSSISSV